MQKAGKSSFYELVTVPSINHRKAIEASYQKEKKLLEGLMFQKEPEVDPLVNVDNAISVNKGINFQKLPHIVNWNENEGGRRSQWQVPT